MAAGACVLTVVEITIAAANVYLSVVSRWLLLWPWPLNVAITAEVVFFSAVPWDHGFCPWAWVAITAHFVFRIVELRCLAFLFLG